MGEFAKVTKFQFQYGTIERYKCTGLHTYQLHFNSSMVRLRVSNSDWALLLILRFQFQYGTIERYITSYAIALLAIISIPVWYDWEDVPKYQQAVIIVNFNSSMVRLRERSFHKVEKVFDISIPVWYDWEPLQSATLHHPIIDFNSSMVRLRVTPHFGC